MTRRAAPLRLRLAGGVGLKRQLNGRTGTRLRRRGGWCAVRLEDGRVVKWRSRSWSAVAAGSGPFASLPREVLALILQSLRTADVCRFLCVSRQLSTARGDPETWAHLHLHPHIPPKLLRFAHFVGSLGAKLRTLHVEAGWAETKVHAWLLCNCDVRELREAHISVSQASPNLLVDPLPRPGSIALEATGGLVLQQLRRFGPDRDQSEPASMLEGLRAARELRALHCEVMRRDVPVVCALRSLRAVDAAFYAAADVERCVAALPLLQRLKVREGRGLRLELCSGSLLELDLSEAGRGCTVCSLDCPRLAQFHARDLESGPATGLAIPVPGGNPRGSLGRHLLSNECKSSLALVEFASIPCAHSTAGAWYELVSVPLGCRLTYKKTMFCWRQGAAVCLGLSQPEDLGFHVVAGQDRFCDLHARCEHMLARLPVHLRTQAQSAG